MCENNKNDYIFYWYFIQSNNICSPRRIILIMLRTFSGTLWFGSSRQVSGWLQHHLNVQILCRQLGDGQGSNALLNPKVSTRIKPNQHSMIENNSSKFVLIWKLPRVPSIGPSGKLLCLWQTQNKLCCTCMATFHTCLTVGPIQLIISYYWRAPWSSSSVCLTTYLKEIRSLFLFTSAATASTSSITAGSGSWPWTSGKSSFVCSSSSKRFRSSRSSRSRKHSWLGGGCWRGRSSRPPVRASSSTRASSGTWKCATAFFRLKSSPASGHLYLKKVLVKVKW